MDKRLKELILYIAEECKNDPSFGTTKLNKILFLSDFNYFAWKGQSITKADYMHKPNGPVAKRLLPAIHDLVAKERRAEQRDEDYFGYTVHRIIPLTGADASSFTKEELAMVDMIIEKTRDITARDLSEWTHSLNPWLVTEDGENIPYAAMFVLTRMPVEADGIKWAKEELKKIKKNAA